MTTTTTALESGQGRRSAAALSAAMEASWATSDARSQYRAALIELRRTRALVKAAEAVERAAMLAYEATDYTT